MMADVKKDIYDRNTVKSAPYIGDLIKGQYLLLKKLGEGGFGAVYEAYERQTKQHFALKVSEFVETINKLCTKKIFSRWI